MNVIYYLFILVFVNIIDKTYCLCGETFQRASARIKLNDKHENYIADKCIRNLPIEEFMLLSNVKNIYAGTFSNLFHITKIELNGVRIETVEPGFLENTPNLRVLKFERNNLQNLGRYTFDELNLERLDFSSNKIDTIDTGAFQNSIFEYLCLSDNKLTEIDPLWFKDTKITALSITHNEITNLNDETFEGIKNLRSLKLNYNKIRNINYRTFSGLTDLGIVYLSGNMLKEINFEITNALKNIDVSFNRINSIFLDDNVSLWIMSIYPNPFECACLREFWKFTGKKNIRIWDSKSLKKSWKDEYPLCISQTSVCKQNNINAIDLEREYFNILDYNALGRPKYNKEDDFVDLGIIN